MGGPWRFFAEKMPGPASANSCARIRNPIRREKVFPNNFMGALLGKDCLALTPCHVEGSRLGTRDLKSGYQDWSPMSMGALPGEKILSGAGSGLIRRHPTVSLEIWVHPRFKSWEWVGVEQ
jgi:hypothetical protein